MSLLLALGTPAPASADDTVLAELRKPTPVRHYAGIQVFSSFDGSVYRLVIRRAGAIAPVPVAPSKAPFDVDIGPDAKDSPTLIYTRCKVERDTNSGTNRNRGCDLVTFSLAGGGSERPVLGANTTANEVTPTLWQGRIAFTRGSAGARLDRPTGNDRAVAYTRMLAAPRSRPSKRLAQIRRGRVSELELYKGRLAQIVVRSGRIDVRLMDISNSSQRSLLGVGVGELGAQYLAGIGFAGGQLMWALDCASCGRPGIYRHSLSTGSLSHARAPRALNGDIVGLAPFAANGAYIVDGLITTDRNGCGETPEEAPLPCRLMSSRPLSFRLLKR